MAGSAMTFTVDYGTDDIAQHGNVHKVICAWTSDSATGAVASDTAAITGKVPKIVGRLIKAITVPSGTAAPTDLYDITLTDEQGSNVLTASQKTLADRSTSSTQEVYFMLLDGAGTPLAQSLHPVVCDKLKWSIANAGNSKQGTIYLYYQPL